MLERGEWDADETWAGRVTAIMFGDWAGAREEVEGRRAGADMAAERVKVDVREGEREKASAVLNAATQRRVLIIPAPS